MKTLLLALFAAALSGCAATSATSPTRPSQTSPATPPARFDYERDDDLDQDLSRAFSDESEKEIA